MKFKLEDFEPNSCGLMAAGYIIFRHIWQSTGGNPCEGCAWYDNGNCKGYKKLIHAGSSVKQSPFSPKTNQQIADEYRISKRQVSKMRKSGELAEFMERKIKP